MLPISELNNKAGTISWAGKPNSNRIGVRVRPKPMPKIMSIIAVKKAGTTKKM
jgi:hypothetical protein